MKFRNLRMANVLRDELGKILQRDMEFPGALVTITGVEIDGKLETADVNVSILPSAKAAEMLALLVRHQGQLQFALNRKVNFKPMPRIQFRLDRGPENAADVEKILLDQ